MRGWCACIIYINTQTHTDTDTHTHTHTHTHSHSHTHTHTHTHKQTNTHKHTNTHKQTHTCFVIYAKSHHLIKLIVLVNRINIQFKLFQCVHDEEEVLLIACPHILHVLRNCTLTICVRCIIVIRDYVDIGNSTLFL